MLQSPPAQCFSLRAHIFYAAIPKILKFPLISNPVIKYRSRATCEIAALQRALTSRTAAQGSPRGRPLYPEVRPLSTATTHARVHPSLQGSPIWPNSSESALVRHDVKYPDGRRTRCGALSQSQPRSSRGPRCVSVRVFPAGFLSARGGLHCHVRALFPPGHASGEGSRFSNVLAVRAQVGDLRSGLSFLFGLHGQPFLSLPSTLRMGHCSDPNHHQQTPDVR